MTAGGTDSGLAAVRIVENPGHALLDDRAAARAMTRPRVFTAANPGPFTLDGTRTHIVGREVAAVIDPGPDDSHHLRALRDAVAGARRVAVLVTHGHADHSGCARALADALDAPLLGPCRAADGPLADGDAVETDRGALLAVETPGHCAEHLCFLWPRAQALFAGDLMLGEGDTTWVGEYPGCVRDYLASLERIEGLAPSVVYPAHGPPLEDVPGTRTANIASPASNRRSGRGATTPAPRRRGW